MTLKDFDSLSRKRISRIITIMEKKIEKENEIKQKQMKEAEARAKRENEIRNRKAKQNYH